MFSIDNFRTFYPTNWCMRISDTENYFNDFSEKQKKKSKNHKKKNNTRKIYGKKLVSTRQQKEKKNSNRSAMKTVSIAQVKWLNCIQFYILHFSSAMSSVGRFFFLLYR